MAEVFNNTMKHNPDSYRDIFLGLGILLFVVFTVCSLQVKASFQADDLSSSPLELVELAAKAQTDGEEVTVVCAAVGSTGPCMKFLWRGVASYCCYFTGSPRNNCWGQDCGGLSW